MRSLLLLSAVMALLYVAYLQVTSTKTALAPTTGDAKNKMEQVRKDIDKIQKEHMKKLEKELP